LIFASSLIKRVQSILNTKEVRLYPVYMLRAQERQKKVVEWHQDPIYTQNLNPYAKISDIDEYIKKTVNVWLPLCDVSIDQSPLRVAVSSHKYGIFPHLDISDEVDDSNSQVFSLRNPWLSRYAQDQKDLPIRAGSAIFFNHTLAHTSSENRSNRIRWSLDLRFVAANIPSFRNSPGFSAFTKLESWLRTNSVPPLSESERIKNIISERSCYSGKNASVMWVRQYLCNGEVHNCIRPSNFDKLNSQFSLRCRDSKSLKTYNQTLLFSCFEEYRHKPSILFAGESVTRGLFKDFMRIILNSMKYEISDMIGNITDIVHTIQTENVDVSFTFLTGSFAKNIFNKKKISFTENQKKNYIYSHIKLNSVYKQIGAVDFTIIGAAAWDILMVGDVNIFESEMTKLIQLAKRHSSRVILRTETSLIDPSAANDSKIMLYNSKLPEYNRIIYKLSEKFSLMTLDAYNVINSGIRDGALKFGLMEDYHSCSKRKNQNDIRRTLIDAAENVSQKKMKKYKQNTKDSPECLNQHHISCSKCDNNVHSGMGSMAIVQALGTILCKI